MPANRWREVVFALQDATGKTLQTGLVTDTEGKIMVEGLKPGNYQFVETEAPFGYDLDATPIRSLSNWDRRQPSKCKPKMN